MEKLQKRMNMKKLRLIDLFKEMDKDNSGVISVRELQQGVIAAMKDCTTPEKKVRPKSKAVKLREER